MRGKPWATEQQRLTARLDSYARYNSSAKGRARQARYDAKHPERLEQRWEPARNRLHHSRQGGNDG